MTAARRKFGRDLDYQFDDPALLDRALTHRSATGVNNERLEFLGDAALGFIIADLLYALAPDASEGDLSRLRASLVKRDSLAAIARELGVGEQLSMGGGELKSGGFRRKSMLADGLEALLGAIYLDGGFDAVKCCIEHLFAERLTNLPPAETLKDPKTKLQELLQGRGLPLPDYQVTGAVGESHAQVFTVSCTVPALQANTSGEGRSRRRAEQAAALEMLDALESVPVNRP